jgi:hypothetical protein
VSGTSALERIAGPPRSPLAPAAQPELSDEEQEAVDEASALVDEFIDQYQEVLRTGEHPVDSGLGLLPELTGRFPVDTWDEVEHNFDNDWRGDGRVD